MCICGSIECSSPRLSSLKEFWNILIEFQSDGEMSSAVKRVTWESMQLLNFFLLVPIYNVGPEMWSLSSVHQGAVDPELPFQMAECVGTAISTWW